MRQLAVREGHEQSVATGSAEHGRSGVRRWHHACDGAGIVFQPVIVVDALQQHQFQVVQLEPIGTAGTGQQKVQAGAGQQRGAVLRRGGGERHAQRAQLPRRQSGDERLGAAAGADPDPRVRPHVQLGQQRGQALGALVCAGESHGADRRGVRAAFDGLPPGARQQGDSNGVGGRNRHRIERDVRQRHVGRVARRLQQPIKVLREARDGERLEQCAVIFPVQAQLSVLVPHIELQVVAALGAFDGVHFGRQVVQRERVGAAFVHREPNLVQRRECEIALDLEFVDQHVEGDILMGQHEAQVGLGCGDRLADGVILRQTVAKHHCIRKISRYRLEFGAWTVCCRHAEYHVGLVAELV
ncbi:hypothetical protein D3C87_578010 [compost metagenome]